RFQDSAWFHAFIHGFERRLEHAAAEGPEVYLDNLSNPSIKALLIASLFERLDRPVVVVCPDPQTAVKYEFELNQFLSRGLRLDGPPKSV
ncbi:hypothetical protein ABTH36_19675, partial [Acinetobacter baumannii]